VKKKEQKKIMVANESEHQSVQVESSLDQLLGQLTSASTKKQDQSLAQLIASPQLLSKYVDRSPQCGQLFKLLDETCDALTQLSSSAIKLNVSETNADALFECFEQIVRIRLDADPNQDDLCTKLSTPKYFALMTKCLTTKSSTPKNQKLQETCLRLLTAIVNQNVELAKQIAVEYGYFNEHKNWLERFLLQKQSGLREAGIRFLLSFLRHVKTDSDTDRTLLFTVKKIFLNMDQQSSKLHFCIKTFFRNLSKTLIAIFGRNSDKFLS
jgi:hypothetical protein